jgi:hypothetical protein
VVDWLVFWLVSWLLVGWLVRQKKGGRAPSVSPLKRELAVGSQVYPILLWLLFFRICQCYCQIYGHSNK